MLGLGISLARGAFASIITYVKDGLKLFYNFTEHQDNPISHASTGSTSFDGTDDYIDCGNDSSLQITGKTITVSAWFKLDGDTDFDHIVANTDGGNYEDGWNLFYHDQKLKFSINHWSTNVAYVAFTDYGGGWHHVVGTYDGTNIQIYLDGVAGTSDTYTANIGNLRNTFIGAGYGTAPTEWWVGSIANVGIWSRALSASEVQGIMYKQYSDLGSVDKASLVSWWGLEDTSLGSEEVTNGGFDTDSDWSKYGSATISGGSAYLPNGGGYISQTSVTTSGKVYYYTISAKGTEGVDGDLRIDSNGIKDTIESLPSTYATYNGYFTADSATLILSEGASGQIYIDSVSIKEFQSPDSHGSNEGNIVGATTNSTIYGDNAPQIPRILDVAQPKQAVQLADGSTSFDGSDDYINVADSNDLSFGDGSDDSAFTISAWVKMDDATSFTIASKGIYNSTAEWKLGLASDDKFLLIIYDESVADTYEYGLYNTALTSYENQWVHLTGTYDGRGGTSATDGISLYVNGSSVTVTTGGNGTYVAMENLGADVHISREGSAYSNGSIANVSIHSSALTQTQVQELMFTEKYAGLTADLKTNLVSWYDLGDTSLGSELNTLANATSPTNETDATTGWTNPNFETFDSRTQGSEPSGDYSLYLAGTADKYAYEEFTVKIGVVYTVVLQYITNGQNMNIMFGTSGAGNQYSNSIVNDVAWTTLTQSVTATSTSLFVSFQAIAGTPDRAIWLDTLSVKEYIIISDLQGSNDGSIIGATTTTGYTSSPHGVVDPINYGTIKSGTAVNFDGSNDEIAVADTNDLSFGDGSTDSPFSISAWINMDDATEFPIITKGTYNSDAEWQLRVGSDDKLYLYLYDESVADTVEYASTPALTGYEGIWTHMACSYSGVGGTSANAGIKLYINGVSQTLGLGGAGTYVAMENLADEVRIGNYDDSVYADGKMNNLKIFSAELTESEIQEMYLNPEQILPTGVSSSNLKLYLPMNEGDGTYTYDGSGNQNHGTISGATWVKAETDIAQVGLVRQNKPMIFDGSDDYVDLPDLGFSGNSAITVAGWVKCDDIADRNMFWSVGLADNDRRIDFEVGTPAVSDAGNIGIHVSGGLWSTRADVIVSGAWHHIAFTLTGTGTIPDNLSLYIDGVSRTIYLENGSEPRTLNLADTNYFIGARREGTADGAPTGQYHDGLINEVAIWDVALDADAITALYNSGTPLDATADSGNYDNSGDLQGYWRNDNDTTWTDRSTNSNDGTASGSPDSIVLTEGLTSGRDSQGFYLTDTTENCLTLNGAEYVEASDSDVLSFGDGTDDRPFSVEAWVNMNDATNFIIATKGIYNSTGEWLFAVGSDDKLKLQLHDESVADTYEIAYYNTALTSYEGQWVHLCGTYNGVGGTSANGGIALYVNGAGVAETLADNGTYVAMENLGADVQVGRYDTDYSDGKIDDVRIYSQELSASEVEKNYNAGKSKHS